MEHPVDLVVNVFERTYAKVLTPGFFPGIEAQNQRRLTQKVALINNVDDTGRAENLAKRLVQTGELDAYYFVADHLDRALRVVGLTRRDLGRVAHWTDCAFVAATLPGGSTYLLYWDADVQLSTPANWVDPSIDLMERDSRIMVANPNWRQPTLEKETLWTEGGFAFGYGVSDQLFLVRRDELGRPIYKCRCLASLRYPLAHVASVFEERLDAYMRTHRRLRATYTQAVYFHPLDEGAGYPAISRLEKLRFRRNRLIVRLLKRSPFTLPCWKL